MTIDLKDKLYTSTQVADILGVSLRTLYRYMEDGKIDSMRTASGRHRFTRDNILNFLNGDKGISMSDIVNPGQQYPSQSSNRPQYESYVQDTKYNSPPPVQNYVKRKEEDDFYNSQFGGQYNSKPEIQTQLDNNLQQRAPYEYQRQPFTSPVNQPRVSEERGNYTQPQTSQSPQTAPSYKVNNNFDFLDDDFLTPTVNQKEVQAPSSKEDIKLYDEPYVQRKTYDDDLSKFSKTNKIQEDNYQESKKANTYQDVNIKNNQLNNQVQSNTLEDLNIEYFTSSIQDLVELARLVKQNAGEFNLRYGFTGYAGASLLTSIKPFTLLHFYIDSYDYNFWVKTLGLKRASQAEANIAIVQSKNFRLKELKNIGGFYVIELNQLKQDLITLGEDEIANRL